MAEATDIADTISGSASGADAPGSSGLPLAGAGGMMRSRAVLAVAVPFIVSSVMFSLKLTLDRLLLSWHSHVSMSASLAAGMTAYMAAGVFVGIAGYTSVLVAQLDGEGMREKIGPCVWQSVVFSVAAGLGLLVLGLAASPLFAMAGHPPRMAAEEAASFRILSGGSALSLVATSLACFWTGRKRTWTAVMVNLLAFAPSAAVTWALVFGAGGHAPDAGAPVPLAAAAGSLNALGAALGAPAMGAAGAAWGTVAGDLVKVLMFGALFLSRGNRERYGTFPGRILEPRAAAGLMRGGFGNGVHLFLTVGSLAAFNMAAGLQGGAAGASAVAFSFGSAALVPVIGLGSALALLVGHGMGAGSPERAVGALRCSGRLAFMYLAAVAAVCLAFPDGIVSLFSSSPASPELRGEAGRLLMLSAAFVLCDGISVVFCGAARGAGDTPWVMKMTGCVAASQIVLAIAAALAGGGAAALWGVLVLGSFFKALLGYFRLSGGAWLGNATAGRLFAEVPLP
ncbi:MAG: hypothetical protein LBR80_09420 [Deltaproteobacteria bacterium]|nr:hypothetical protein [Deltaproteobacteria bacterium]